MSLYCALEIRVDGNGPSLIIRTFWLKKKKDVKPINTQINIKSQTLLSVTKETKTMK